MKRLKPRG
jgi:site-specific DNA recombinase